jgi:iron-sulfur cluster assembly protein
MIKKGYRIVSKGVINMVTLTEAAAEKVRALIEQKNKPELGLRLFIKPGGCSGFNYGLALDVQKEDDQTFSQRDINIFVDPNSAPFVDGATIDYVENMMGGGFKIDNPNAISTCGCGSSFRTAKEHGQPGSCC